MTHAYDELIKRLEAACAISRHARDKHDLAKMDAEIELAIQRPPDPRWCTGYTIGILEPSRAVNDMILTDVRRWHLLQHHVRGTISFRDVPRYTTSLDAATDLLDYRDTTPISRDPLEVCIAALRARQSLSTRSTAG